MKTFLLTLSFLFITLVTFNISSFSQSNLNWGSSFSPIYSSNTSINSATHIDGTSVNCDVTLNLSPSAVYTYANGVSGAMSPTVTGATYTVPGSTNRLQVGVDFRTTAQTCDMNFHFTSLVTGVAFRIADIDKPTSTSFSSIDKVIVTGTDGTTTYKATITKYDATTDPDFLTIVGNSVSANPVSGKGGNSASDATDQLGTVNVSFGGASINSITVTFTNDVNAQANPGTQAIAIGNITFGQPTLPVSLSAFSGHRQSSDVVLNWTSQQEIRVAAFEIERSTGNNVWSTIGSVAPRNANNTATDYSYTDLNAQGAVVLYRLKMVDADGKSKYSTIIRITGKDGVAKISSYPNPFTEQVNVSVNSSTNQKANATIADVTGKTISTETKNLYAGSNNFTIAGLDRLTKGIYYLQIKDADGNLLGASQIVKN